MMRLQSNYQPYPIYTTVLTGKCLPPHVGYRTRIPPGVMDLLDSSGKQESGGVTMKQKIVQSMFRESEAQTEPYVVDVVTREEKGLEILSLGWLSWNNGLPAGMNEIKTIERARQKRAWESALPAPFDEGSRELRTMIIEAMEINEWNYREEMIAAMGSLRLELAKKLMKERCEDSKAKYESRLTKYIKAKREEKSKKIQKLKQNFNREVRKLSLGLMKVNQKYHRWNIIKQFKDKTSEMYAPQLRFGENPRHWHETISPGCRYWRVFKKMEILHHTAADIPEPLKPAFDFNKNSKPRGPLKELCIRASRCTEDKLSNLHEEFRNIRRRRRITPKPCYLKKRVVAQAKQSETPFVKGVPDEEERMFQACLFLQKTVKGRAIQIVMFDSRVKCQELIEELKSTHALQKNMEDVKAVMRRRVFGLQRQEEIEQMQERRKNEIMCALEGKTTGDMLDFLAKELLRLQHEKTIQAMAMAAERERHKREATEAGRRQAEEKRRGEHDEMFKQIMKMHQNTVQAFLEDTMLHSRHWTAHRQAREYVTEMAQKIDQAALQMTKTPIFAHADDMSEHELIADLIHNFALPEAEKRMVRERLKEKQKNYLSICHDEVYSSIEKCVQGARTDDGKLLPLPKTGKHKIPPIVKVKYLRLKRMHESSSSSIDSQNSATSLFNEQFALEHRKELLDAQLSSPKDEDAWSSGFSRQEVILENDQNSFGKQ